MSDQDCRSRNREPVAVSSGLKRVCADPEEYLRSREDALITTRLLMVGPLPSGLLVLRS